MQLAGDYLNENAGAQSQGKCATFIRRALEVVEFDMSVRPELAKDYGPKLEAIGFSSVDQENYLPKRGDVIVLQPPTGQMAGHIEMYNGERWVSDFFQRKDDVYPGPAYRQQKVEYDIYRYEKKK